MKITYYALQTITVGDDIREAGDLVPEAMFWRNAKSYVNENKLATVLVATLPEAVRDKLEFWELEQVEIQKLADEVVATLPKTESKKTSKAV